MKKIINTILEFIFPETLESKRKEVVEQYHNIMESEKWYYEVPSLNFPSQWEVTILPPIRGVIVRIFIQDKQADTEVSVYLDCYGHLRNILNPVPYWEVWSYHQSREYRCNIKDSKSLLENIKQALDPTIRDTDWDDNEN